MQAAGSPGGPGPSLSSLLLLTVRLCSSKRASLLLGALLPPLSTHRLRPCLQLAAEAPPSLSVCAK